MVSTADVDGGVSAATVSGTLTTGADLLELVRRADAAATTAPADDDARPPAAGGADKNFADAAEQVGPEDFAGLARDLGTAFARARGAGHLLFGFAEYRRTTIWLAGSTGLRRRAVDPMGRIEVNAKMPDLINSAWVGRRTNDFTDVDLAAVHAELETRLAWGERRVDLPPGEYETILPAGAVVDLLFSAYASMGGRDAEEAATPSPAPRQGPRASARSSPACR